MTQDQEYIIFLHALQKWEWLAYNESDIEKMHLALPQLSRYRAACSFCSKYTCPTCPLQKEFKASCTSEDSPFYKWAHSAYNKQQDWAEFLRDAIQRIAAERGYTFSDDELGVLK